METNANNKQGRWLKHNINDIESSITFVDSTHSRFDCTYEYLANS